MDAGNVWIEMTDEDDIVRAISLVPKNEHAGLLRRTIRAGNLVAVRVLIGPFGVQPELSEIRRAVEEGRADLERLLVSGIRKWPEPDFRATMEYLLFIARRHRAETLDALLRTEPFRSKSYETVIGSTYNLQFRDNYTPLNPFTKYAMDRLTDFLHGATVDDPDPLYVAGRRKILENLLREVIRGQDEFAEACAQRMRERKDYEAFSILLSFTRRSFQAAMIGFAVRLGWGDAWEHILCDSGRCVHDTDLAWGNADDNAMKEAIKSHKTREARMLLEHKFCKPTDAYVKYCLEVGGSECLRILFEAGAKMQPGYLLAACEKQDVSTVRVLLDFGADPDATTLLGRLCGRRPDTVCKDNRAILLLLDDHRSPRPKVARAREEVGYEVVEQ